MNRLVTLVVAGTLAAGCSSDREPAESALKGLETAVAAARPDVERFAPDRMATVDESVKLAKSKVDTGNFAGARTDIVSASGALTAAAEAAAARKAELSTEWATFASMPVMIGRVKGRVAELDAMRRLPRGTTKAGLDGAKSSLDAATTLWDDATEAHGAGHLVVAVAKARQARPIVESMMATLGLPATATP